MTKNDKLLDLIQRVVTKLKAQAPPTGMTDVSAISAYYQIFKGPARWKAGIRTPQEMEVPVGKLNPPFKRGRVKLALS